MMRPLTSLCRACLLSVAAGASAKEPPQPRYNTVEFQAEAQREVQNDLLNATLYAEFNDPSPAVVANSINQATNDALRIAKGYGSVRARSGNSQTFPVYTKGNVLQGWRGRAEIRLESRDFEAASSLIGKLQSTLQLAGMTFQVSPEARRSAENELIAEAIKSFKARAEIVKSALGGREYKLERLSVTSGYNGPAPRFERALAAAAPQAVTAPNLEAGTSMVTVTARGSIELVQ